MVSSAPRSASALLVPYFLVFWLAAKIAFVNAVVPQCCVMHHNPVPSGEMSSPTRPCGGHVLYLFRLKDEGVLF